MFLIVEKAFEQLKNQDPVVLRQGIAFPPLHDVWFCLFGVLRSFSPFDLFPFPGFAGPPLSSSLPFFLPSHLLAVILVALLPFFPSLSAVLQLSSLTSQLNAPFFFFIGQMNVNPSLFPFSQATNLHTLKGAATRMHSCMYFIYSIKKNSPLIKDSDTMCLLP